MGGLADTAQMVFRWGLVWAMLAVAACMDAVAAAATLFRREIPEPDWFAGYNALATVVDRR
jgi:hypothetical protein